MKERKLNLQYILIMTFIMNAAILSSSIILHYFTQGRLTVAEDHLKSISLRIDQNERLLSMGLSDISPSESELADLVEPELVLKHKQFFRAVKDNGSPHKKTKKNIALWVDYYEDQSNFLKAILKKQEKLRIEFRSAEKNISEIYQSDLSIKAAIRIIGGLCLLLIMFLSFLVHGELKKQAAEDLANQTQLKEVNSQLGNMVRKFRLAAEVSKWGVWEWDLKTAKVDWDEQMYQMHGIHPHFSASAIEAYGKVIHPDDDELIKSSFTMALAAKNNLIQYQHRIITPEGQIRNISVAGSIQYDSSGKAESIVGCSWDITEQKNRENRYLNSISLQRSIIENPAIMVVVTDSVGTITFMNSLALRTFQYSSEELVGKATPGMWHDKEEIKKRSHAISEELGYEVEPGFRVFVERLDRMDYEAREWNMQRKDGTRFPGFLTVSRMKNENGEVLGYLGLIKDVTKQRQLEAELASKQVQLISQLKMASLGEMAGGLAHEINNPLAIIQGRAQQLMRAAKNDQMNKDLMLKNLEVIDKTTDRIAKIISGLRTFSRDADHDEMVVCSVDGILEETLAFCGEKFKNRGVVLNIVGDKDIFIKARPTQLSQVFLNLLNNACDAVTDLPEKWVRVEVYHSRAEECTLTVTDSGSGIPQSVAEKIMNPFFTTKGPGKGTGLGLSISKGIVEDHGGTLRLNSNSPHTEFVMTLPKVSASKAKIPAQGAA